jgi:hypothetical protein
MAVIAIGRSAAVEGGEIGPFQLFPRRINGRELEMAIGSGPAMAGNASGPAGRRPAQPGDGAASRTLAGSVP